MRRLLLLVFFLIVYGSLYPWQFHFGHGGHASAVWLLLHSEHSDWTRFDLRDFILNVLLYFPFGLAACAVLIERGWRPPAAMLSAAALGFGLSVAMELLQVYDAGRNSSRFDVESNTLGAVAGAVAALVYLPSLRKLSHRHSARPLAAAGLLLIACWIAYQLYPFFPAISTTSLRAGIHRLAGFDGFALTEVCAGAAEWFAAALALAAVFGRLPARWLALAMLMLPLRIFIASRALAAGELVSALLALLLWRICPPRLRLRGGLTLMVTAIIIRELTPFHFLANPMPFSWIPFYGSFNSDWQSAVVILFRKAFDYGAAVWLLRSLGLSYWRAGMSVASALFFFELVQRYVPGHVPETTDGVLALFMALALSSLSRMSERTLATPRHRRG